MTATVPTRQPLLWAALAFAAGIAGSVHFWRPAAWWLAASAVLLVASLHFHKLRFSEPAPESGSSPQSERYRRRRLWLAWGLALGAYAALGAWCLQAADSALYLPDLSRFATGAQVTITGHVIRDGVLRRHNHWTRQTLDMETETAAMDEFEIPITAIVRLSVYSRSQSRSQPQMEAEDDEPDDPGVSGAAAARKPPPTDKLEADSKSIEDAGLFPYGQRLRFPVKLHEPRNFQNPGAPDFRAALLRQGIVATGAVALEKIELLSGPADRFWGRSGRLRRDLLGMIHRLWPPSEAVLFDAILVGERSYLDRDSNSIWQRTGLYHLLIVSGMKVGILAGFVFWIARKLRANEILASVLALLGSLLYAGLAEMQTPVLRAVLMLAVFLVTRLLYREHALLNALGAAALILLAAEPRTLFEASFQLTFFCVWAIAALAVPILERTSGPYRRGLRALLVTGYDFALPPRLVQFRVELRMLAEHLAQLLPGDAERATRAAALCVCLPAHGLLLVYDAVMLSFVTQLAMTLPMAAYFHRAIVVGLPANAIAVPLTGVLVPAAALALLMGYAWLPLAKLPALVASWSLRGIIGSMNFFAGWHISDVRLPTPEWGPAMAVVVGLILAMFLVRRRAGLAVTGLALLMAASAWLTLFPAHQQVFPGVLEVTAIDVGQAESTLVVTPQGRTMLVDAGGSLGPWQSEFDFGEDVVGPYLWSRGFTHLDVLVLTHAHSDHIGGMRGVVADFHPAEFWLGPNAETAMLRELKQALQQQGARIISRRTGEEFEFGGASFRVLSPPPNWQPKRLPSNNDSLVLLAKYGATAALLTGDIEKQLEPALAAQQPRADLLKIAHNGSATSTTPELLAAVQPRFAVIHVGRHNMFGHPRREVLERLSQAKVATYRTDMAGTMMFILDGKSVAVRPRRLLEQSLIVLP